ncbi:hypothetical protein D9758_011615 [Tetrapyrgos nigripes]|uniref:Caspase domain-containing protein n=1 Tax=Tetrapyrgos nigripes TaxID=182062 RepID=A0A8H5FSF2_9AGAR|nr:hypothetical protein D9758_011615 [Tetrapyrgos nigripes]
MSRQPTFHAILVAINEYDGTGFLPLKSALSDSGKIRSLLKRLGAEDANITCLLDADATKDNILKAIASLTTKAKRDDPIVFFFSGYSASNPSDSAVKSGVICPVDVLKPKGGGIPEHALLQAFDQVSKRCGNNITLLLDCTAKVFAFNKPESCVIVMPDEASEIPGEGGLFTKAIVDVLDPDKRPFKSMTVWSFVGHLKVVMEAQIHCVGSNVNRVLFDMGSDERGHHALISGHTSKDGSVILNAGAVHGVRPQATYGIYASNVGNYIGEPLGQLYVDRRDDFEATLRSSDNYKNLDLPPFFFAAEQRDYCDPLRVFALDQDTKLPDGIGGWSPASGVEEANIAVQKEKRANVTLEEEANLAVQKEKRASVTPEEETNLAVQKAKVANVTPEKTRFKWRWCGVTGAEKCGREAFDDPRTQDELQRDIRRAARFNSHLTTTSPDKSSISFRADGRIKLVELPLKAGKEVEAYCLTVYNDSDFSVWPYVFMYDPDGFIIDSWYMPAIPTLGSSSPPLAKKDRRCFGLNDNTSLVFQYRPDRDYDFLYLKVFLTKEWTDLSSLKQWHISSTEDKLRDYRREGNEPSSEGRSTDPGEEKEKPTGRNPPLKQGPDSNWASMRIDIVQKYLHPPN